MRKIAPNEQSTLPGINPVYLGPTTMKRIAAVYRRDGVVVLRDFLSPMALRSTINACRGKGRREERPDKHRYTALNTPTIARAIDAYVLSIAGEKPVRDGTRRFHHRDYTLLHDAAGQKPGVIAPLFLDAWEPAWGGRVVLRKGSSTIANIAPHANTLAIVRREKGVQSFVKYVNHRAGKKALTIVG
jgi:hypothetical protein